MQVNYLPIPPVYLSRAFEIAIVSQFSNNQCPISRKVILENSTEIDLIKYLENFKKDDGQIVEIFYYNTKGIKFKVEIFK